MLRSSQRWVGTFRLVFVLSIGILSAGSSFGQSTTGNQPNEVRVALLEKPITVAPAQYRYERFTIPARSRNVQIQGRFEASGGGRNDIAVFILDEDAFINFQNRHRVAAHYSSGKVTVGKINVQLPEQDKDTAYYIVWSNQFSVVSNKIVDGDVTVSYER